MKRIAIMGNAASGKSYPKPCPDEAPGEAAARFIRLGKYQDKIGWGYGDYLADIAARVQRRRSKRVRDLGQHAV